jgi:acetyl/propionyl-CoA carboxylase alpha subunit
MGLPTIGICAPGDEQARHVTYADEIQLIKNYLDIPGIIQVARESGATLIHPGYGFLSERPAFAQAVQDAGLIFVGPRPETMSLMGDKIAAKELAVREKVPTAPWAKVAPGADLLAEAQRVGFPLLLKAAAGGGGKGMRKVMRPEELLPAAESASSEALAAFGMGLCFWNTLSCLPDILKSKFLGTEWEEAFIYLRESVLSRGGTKKSGKRLLP